MTKSPPTVSLAEGWAIEREAIKLAIRKTEYKYFGDYEMSDDQREAVDLLVSTAERYLASPAHTPAPDTRLPDTPHPAVEVTEKRARDDTCIVVKKNAWGRVLETVICGQCIVEGYLRKGYVYDWTATDAARSRDAASASTTEDGV